MTRSSIWDSAASTQSWASVRSMGRGVWRTGLVLLLGFTLWAALERGGVERHLSLEARWQLEVWRPWLGPVLLLPALLTAMWTWNRLRKSPLLPGRRVLAALVGMGIMVLGVLAPWAALSRASREEALCREIHLPMAWRLWKDGKLPPSLPSCPCQWEEALGSYVLAADEKAGVVLRDSRGWHQGHMLGVTRQGEVVTLSAGGEIPPH